MAGFLCNATTTKVEDTTLTGFDVSQFTLGGWLWAISTGEGTFGRVFCADENEQTNGFYLSHTAVASRLRFQYNWNAGANPGTWTFAATDGQYNAVAVKYDRGATTNDPVARVNFSAPTITEATTPSGTATAPNAGYCIGNRSAADRTWDGGIMDLQFHPTLLSDSDMDKMLKVPGSVRTTGAYWWPLFNGTYDRLLTWDGSAWVNAAAPTITAGATFTAGRPGARMAVDFMSGDRLAA
jgi:hypothetical protein